MAAGKGVLHGGGAVASGVGHGLGSVGGFAGRRIGLIKKKDKSGKEVLVDADEAGEPLLPQENGHSVGYEQPPGVAEPAHVNGVTANQTEVLATPLPSGNGAGPSEPGTLTVTVVGAQGLRSKEGSGTKAYVQLRMGGKIHKTGHVRGTEPEW